MATVLVLVLLLLVTVLVVVLLLVVVCAVYSLRWELMEMTTLYFFSDLPLTNSRLSETIASSPNTSEPISTRPNVDSSAFECRCQAV